MIEAGDDGHQGVEVVEFPEHFQHLNEFFKDLDSLLDPWDSANLCSHPKAYLKTKGKRKKRKSEEEKRRQENQTTPDLVEPVDIVRQIFSEISLLLLAWISPEVNHELLWLNFLEVLKFNESQLPCHVHRVQGHKVHVTADGHGLLDFLLLCGFS